MTPEEKAAFVVAQAAILNARVQGMVAENMQRSHRGESMAYMEDHFVKVVDESGIGHNDLIGWLGVG